MELEQFCLKSLYLTHFDFFFKKKIKKRYMKWTHYISIMRRGKTCSSPRRRFSKCRIILKHIGNHFTATYQEKMEKTQKERYHNYYQQL